MGAFYLCPKVAEFYGAYDKSFFRLRRLLAGEHLGRIQPASFRCLSALVSLRRVVRT